MMMRTNDRPSTARQPARFCAVAAACICAVTTSNLALAEIRNTTASVSAIAQERISGEPASVTSSNDALLPDASNLPLSASAELTSTDLVGELIAMGLAFSDFNDPTRLDQPNPEEFAIEAACYSAGTDVSYFVQATAIESRVVHFGNNEVTFSTEGTVEVESTIFVSGAIIVWATGNAVDPSTLGGTIEIAVSRDETEFLFDTTLTITSTTNGQIETAVTGELEANAVTLDELAGVGLDPATLAVLQAVEDTGTLLVLILPAQQHTYTYTVLPDREHTLSAALSAELTNAPGGTGIAAVLGRPFENMAAFIAAGLPGTDGEVLQAAINEAINEQSDNPPVSSPGGDTPSGGGSSSLCGAMGAEFFAFAPLSFGLIATRRRRDIRTRVRSL